MLSLNPVRQYRIYISTSLTLFLTHLFQFAISMKNMQRDTVRGNWDGDWLPNVSGKQAIYNGLAQYHQSRICNAQKAVGEEIARFV